MIVVSADALQTISVNKDKEIVTLTMTVLTRRGKAVWGTAAVTMIISHWHSILTTQLTTIWPLMTVV